MAWIYKKVCRYVADLLSKHDTKACYNNYVPEERSVCRILFLYRVCPGGGQPVLQFQMDKRKIHVNKKPHCKPGDF